VIHAADSRYRVVQAGRDAGSQDRRHQRRLVAGENVADDYRSLR